MKRKIAAALAILGVVGVAGWKLASNQEPTLGLQDVSLIDRSEHSQPGPDGALAGIRVRISPSDFDESIRSTANEVPQIAIAAE